MKVSRSSQSKDARTLYVELAIFAIICAISCNTNIRAYAGFAIAQYEQNVGGRIISSEEYLRNGVATKKQIQSLLSIGAEYPLTENHFRMYEEDGFVVLENFLNATEADTLDRVAEYNLDQLAFPDMLTSCNRKFHGEFYHSSVTRRFWQQPRIANMLSKLALGGEDPYMVTSEILETRSDGKGGACIPQWHWDFLTFPQKFEASYKSGTQIWMSLGEKVDEEMGGGMAFLPGSHLWANDIDDDAIRHPCFVMNLFEPLNKGCSDMFDSHMVIPTLKKGDIVVFSRLTLHRSVPRKPSYPFESRRRLGTLRIGPSSSEYKKNTMSCFPSHPTANFDGQLRDGQRYDSVIDTTTVLASDAALHRPMRDVDSEDMILSSNRGMSVMGLMRYSLESIFRQEVHYKLANAVEITVNNWLGTDILDIKCQAAPTPDNDGHHRSAAEIFGMHLKGVTESQSIHQ